MTSHAPTQSEVRISEVSGALSEFFPGKQSLRDRCAASLVSRFALAARPADTRTEALEEVAAHGPRTPADKSEREVVDNLAQAMFEADDQGSWLYAPTDVREWWIKMAQTALAALPVASSRSASVAERSWQPIETAPRDGTKIIVYRPKFDGDYIPQVGWDFWMTRGVMDPTWGKSRKDVQPTHWMPFPAAPSVPSAQSGGPNGN